MKQNTVQSQTQIINRKYFILFNKKERKNIIMFVPNKTVTENSQGGMEETGTFMIGGRIKCGDT